MFWRKVIGFWKSILVIGAITYVSLLREPNVSLPHIVGIDKWIHGVMYFLLTLTLLWDSQTLECHHGSNGSNGAPKHKLWWIVFAFSVIYGGFIEVLQELFFYPRTGDWWDWLADCMGVVVGMIVWIIGTRWYARRVAK